MKIHLCVIFGLSSFQVWQSWKQHGTTSQALWCRLPSSAPNCNPVIWSSGSPSLYHTKKAVWMSLFPVFASYCMRPRALRHASPNTDTSAAPPPPPHPYTRSDIHSNCSGLREGTIKYSGCRPTTTAQGQSSHLRVCSRFRPCRPSLNPG